MSPVRSWRFLLMALSWLQRLRKTKSRPGPRKAPRRWLGIETLEDRLAPVVGATAIPAAIVGDSPGNASTGVVRLTDSLGSTCTGTLLSTGRHILTAAHCVDHDVDTDGDG